MKEFIPIYDMIIDYLASANLSAFERVCEKEHISMNQLGIREILGSILSEVVDPLLVELYQTKKACGDVYGKDRAERSKLFCQIFNVHDLFGLFPLAEEMLKTRVDDYINLQSEIITQYAIDKNKISSVFSTNYGEIKKIITSLGDTHNGKSVSILVCENGTLVYKPHSLLTDAFLNDILGFFSDKLNINIRTPNYVTEDKYGWQEYIEFATCKTVDDLHKFYYKIGIYLAVFYLLATCDMHYENLIACESSPIFFDTESIITATTSENDPNYRLLQNTVLNTAVLPTYNDKGIYDINFSAIFTGKISPGEKEVVVLKTNDREDFVYKKEKHNLVQQYNKNVPKLSDNYELPLSMAISDILSGFDAALIEAVANKEELLKKYNNPIYTSMELRQVIRPTKVYYTFLVALTTPLALNSMEKQEQIIDILFDNFSASASTGYLRVEAEAQDLRKGYIPKFHAKYSQKNLFSNEKNVCENFFIRTPKELIVDKLLCLNYSQIVYQKRLITMALQTVAPDNFRMFSPKDLNIRTNDSEIAVVIKEYANYLMDNMIRTNGNISSFMMLFPSDDTGHFNLKYIDSTIYHGGGIILFILAYSQCFNDPKAEKMGRDLLDYLIFSYNQEKMSNQYAIEEKYRYSLYEGYGGLLYLCEYAARILKDNRYWVFYNALRDDFLDYYLQKELDASDFDYVHGILGILSAVCKAESAMNKAGNYDIDERIYRLCVKVKDKAKTCEINNHGMAHGALGICQTLMRAYQYTLDQTLLDEAVNYFDICTDLEESSDLSWCKGKAGLLLACSGLFSIYPKGSEFRNQKKQLLSNLVSDISQNYLNQSSLCICHGVYGSLDILLTLQEMNICHISPEIFSHTHISSLRDYNWFASTDAPFESFMMGSSGVGYVLLRLLQGNLDSALF